MARTGRPPELEREVIVHAPDGTERRTTKGTIFLEELARGTSQLVAAEISGLGHSTVLNYIARGTEGTNTDRSTSPLFEDFARNVREAKAQGQAIHERTITLAAVPRPVTTTKRGWRDVMAPDGTVHRLNFEETSTREEYDWRASAWALTHQYGVTPPPVEVELVNPAEREEQANALAASLSAYLAGRDDQAADDADVS